MNLLKVSRVFRIVDTKNRILKSAELLFLRLGIKSITMDDIAKELGISKKTIYLHFIDKNQIVNEVISIALEREKIEAEVIYKKAKNPIDEIFLSTNKMYEIFENINPVMLFDLQKYHPQAWDKYLAFKINFLDIVKRNMLDGIHQKLYRSDVDVEIMAKLRVESVDLAFNMKIFSPKNFKLITVQIHFIDHFIRGIVSPIGLEIYEKYKQELKINTL